MLQLPRPTSALAAVLAAALAAPAAAQTVWTVDDDPGADFDDLQAAIDAAAPGDVLHVFPRAGDEEYGPAVLAKELVVIGEPEGAPLQLPRLERLDVPGPDGVTLKDLRVRDLRLNGVAATAQIEGCELGVEADVPGLPVWPGASARVVVEDCADVRLTSCTVRGGFEQSTALGLPALLVRGATTLQVASSTIEGADVPNVDPLSGVGGTGIEARDAARVWLAATDVRGGDGGNAYFLGSFHEPGYGGAAILAGDAARVDARGTAAHELAGGLQNGAGTHVQDPPSGPEDGDAVTCLPASAATVELSGVTTAGAVGACASSPAAFAAFLHDAGTSDPGPGLDPVRTLRVYGQAGSACVLALALDATLLDVPVIEGAPLGLALDAVLVLWPGAIGGPGTPASFSFPQPGDPTFPGLGVHAQAVEIPLAGGFVGTNALSIALGV